MLIRTSAVLPKLAVLLLTINTMVGAAAPVGRVEVVNTPSVTVANTPSVNVKSLPAVQLAPGATVSIAGTPAVHIDSTASTPLPVHDPATPVRTPIQLSFQITAADGVIRGDGVYNVPKGKRLVIEYASVFGSSSAEDTLIYSVITGTTPPQSQPFSYLLPVTQAFGVGNARNFIAGQTMKIFSDPESTVDVRVDRTVSTGFVDAIFSISGYLEDVQ
jgi:hypothetical protein